MFSSAASGSSSTRKPIFDDDEDENTITVMWHKQPYKFDLPHPDTPLSVLRQAIAEKTGVPPEHQKLIMAGAIMQKDLPLKTYGLVRPSLSDDPPEKDDDIVSNGFRNLLSKWGLSSTTGKKPRQLKITMIGSPETSAVVSDRLPGSSTTSAPTPQPQSSSSSSARGPPRRTAGPSAPSDEARVVAQIDSLVDATMDKLKSSLNNLTFASKSSQALKTDGFKQQHLYVSETLLQALLKLDGFEIEPKWTEARKTRKEAIKKVQGILDTVDAMKEGKAAPVSPPQ